MNPCNCVPPSPARSAAGHRKRRCRRMPACTSTSAGAAAPCFAPSRETAACSARTDRSPVPRFRRAPSAAAADDAGRGMSEPSAPLARATDAGQLLSTSPVAGASSTSILAVPRSGHSRGSHRQPQLAGCSPSRSGPRVDLRGERLACQSPLWAKRVNLDNRPSAELGIATRYLAFNPRSRTTGAPREAA